LNTEFLNEFFLVISEEFGNAVLVSPHFCLTLVPLSDLALSAPVALIG
jgi:hypothetical protein